MSQVSSVNSSNPKSPNFLIIGQGDIGLKVTNTLAKAQKPVTGLARRERQAYDLNEHAHFLQADALKLTVEQIQDFTHIAIIVAPNNYDAENYKNTYLGIAQHIARLQNQLPQLTRVVFISSTGVYGQDEGQWIDETVEPQLPKREASQYILQAEQVLQQAYGERAVIIRPSGIYGEQRLMRVRKAREQQKEPIPLYDWTNRIMDSDLVNIIIQVLMLEEGDGLKPVYLATDYAPVTSFEITTWLAEQLNSTAPIAKPGTDGHNLSGKRLHSNIPRDWLQFPDWQSGYSYILKSI
ncbi:NAD-dependent epimerase/dehydratase family protein [Psychrobacter sp. UBA3962]|uniref:NAD-dependent epimerase/dehydratase family protein n=1 Tax=Psychrobacter sp. UBA3962 TaxID=1947352 RepID=UPI0025F0359B|nr:NAD-dependent epimerase/dehydratase family protein [Psychrobacter sp. UBA3962]